MEETAIKTLTDLLLTPENLIIMVAAWFLLSVLRKIFPKFFKKPVLARILPILPMVFTVGFIWLPGLRPDMEWGATLLLGVVLGWGVGHLHKTVMQSIFGKGVKEQTQSEPE